MIDKDIKKVASKVIYENKREFQLYVIDNKKLHAIKALKEYTGFFLKECKYLIDLYFDGNLPSYLIEERKNKLDLLGKKIIVEEISLKLSSLKIEDFNNILMNLTIDELFKINDIVKNNTQNK